MKPAPFKYFAASSLDHALSLKAEHGEEARFLAGGQSLIPAMNFRLARPAVLIDINGLNGLAGIEQTRDHPGRRADALLPARARQRLLVDPARCLPTRCRTSRIRRSATAARSAATFHMPIRRQRCRRSSSPWRRGCGSNRSSGEREVAASAFFKGLLTTDIAPDEMLVESNMPKPQPRSGACFMEVARRRGDFAIAGVAAT